MTTATDGSVRKIALVASPTDEAQDALERLARLYECVPVEDADVIVALGGDGFMVEINPLAVTKSGDLVALDAKMTFDDNALFRRPQIAELRDKSQEDPRESHERPVRIDLKERLPSPLRPGSVPI